MRLDKFLSVTATATRSEASRVARAGGVTVNGAVVKKCDLHIDPEIDRVCFRGEPVIYRRFTYIMLNKPDGYVSATDDPHESTVLELLPESMSKLGLFPAGRLDKNTLGLLILTNDGETAHRLLSPKHHAEKRYAFRCNPPITDADAVKLEAGVDIGGYVTKPCRVKLHSPNSGEIVLIEGKYHQIKRMLEAVGSKITDLERISFAGIPLDPSLERGKWRYLSEDEIHILTDR